MLESSLDEPVLLLPTGAGSDAERAVADASKAHLLAYMWQGKDDFSSR